MPSKILVVDDEPDILELVETRLAMAGYETITAESGEEALKSFFTARPDLALLDLEMPGMDGFELCERIRQISDVPIIFLTVFGSEVHRVKGLQVGADDYIVKPFSKNELVARVEANLRRASIPARSTGPARKSAIRYTPVPKPRKFVASDESCE
jgi:OmpR family response regulator RpaB